MKPGSFTSRHLWIIAVVAVATLGLVSWKHQESPEKKQTPQVINDTVPQKKAKEKDKRVRDLDEALMELDNIDLKEHLDNAMKEVAEAMKQIDVAQLKMEMDKAMREVDVEKIRKELEESMSKIEWDKLKVELEKVKSIDMVEVQKEMERVKEEMKKIQPQLEKELAKAKIEVEKAKAEVKEYKSFVDGLEKDGLLNKKENYTIQHKDGKLIVNGKEVSPQVYQKYRAFLQKHPTLVIKKDADDFDIDSD